MLQLIGREHTEVIGEGREHLRERAKLATEAARCLRLVNEATNNVRGRAHVVERVGAQVAEQVRHLLRARPP